MPHGYAIHTYIPVEIHSYHDIMMPILLRRESSISL